MDKLIGQFVTYLSVERNVSRHTLSGYLRDLGQFCSFLTERGYAMKGERIEATFIDDSHIKSFLGLLYGRCRKVTIARKISSLKSFFRYLEKQGVIAVNPAELISTPKVEKYLPTVLTVEETTGLIDAASGGDNDALRERAIIELLYSSGLRVGELVGLDRGDVDMSRGVVRVMGKGGKERLVPVGKAALEALRRYLEKRDDIAGEKSALFLTRRGKRIYPRAVQRSVKRFAAVSGIAKRPTPHSLRHTFATHLLDSGVDLRAIQEMLGHASVSTTQRYTKVGIDSLMKVYDTTHPRARRGGNEGEAD
ncbi:MAG: tyrosine recombinase XerC [Deltaproteobacteria bacterium]|nr:tyrosine recombinase XerC [Deltaproteobacteria bacterium]